MYVYLYTFYPYTLPFSPYLYLLENNYTIHIRAQTDIKIIMIIQLKIIDPSFKFYLYIVL